MKFQLNKEIPIWVLILFPILYLIINWSNIPEIVPVHFNAQGEADQWGSKFVLFGIATFIPLLFYAIFLIVPIIDPKGKIQNMGEKYYHLRFLFSLLAFAIVIVVLLASIQKIEGSQHYIFMITGGIFLVLGNYAPAIQPNYFIGLRTPWTLENEEVWKETHRFGSKIWFWGGLLVILTNLMPFFQPFAFLIFIFATTLLALIPFIYSYITYKRLQIK